MSKCGYYTIPLDPDNDKAGAGEQCRGTGEAGCQPDFASYLDQLTAAAGDQGISISYGHGYMGRDEANDDYDSGQPQYINNIQYFGWGLAREITNVYYLDQGNGDAAAWIRDNAATYGLTLKEYSEDGKGAVDYLRPMEVRASSTVSVCTYAGDNTATSDTSNGSTDASTASVSSIAYYFANQFATQEQEAIASMLTGERALANDKQLWGSIQTCCAASLRSCMSGPSGEFVAWYPDKWGLVDSTPFLILEDVELIDLTITQSDDSFYSHVYVPGCYASGTSLTISDYIGMGVVSIESPVSAQASSAAVDTGLDAPVSDEVSAILKKLIYIPEGEEWKYTPKELYRRYGARPDTTNSVSSAAGLIESGSTEDDNTHPQYILPFLYALYEFMDKWSKQYQATLQIAWMPELFPGCRIKVKSLDISFYVESVSHSMSYSNGFTTTVNASCPVGSLVSGLTNPQKVG